MEGAIAICQVWFDKGELGMMWMSRRTDGQVELGGDSDGGWPSGVLRCGSRITDSGCVWAWARAQAQDGVFRREARGSGSEMGGRAIQTGLREMRRVISWPRRAGSRGRSVETRPRESVAASAVFDSIRVCSTGPATRAASEVPDCRSAVEARFRGPTVQLIHLTC